MDNFRLFSYAITTANLPPNIALVKVQYFMGLQSALTLPARFPSLTSYLH